METTPKKYILEVFLYFIEWTIVDRIVHCDYYLDKSEILASGSAICSTEDTFSEAYGMWLSMKRMLQRSEHFSTDIEFRKQAWKRFLNSEPIKGKWLKPYQRVIKPRLPKDLSGYMFSYKGERYLVREVAKRKNERGKWVDCIIYTCEKSNFIKTYVRDYNQFISRFRIINDTTS